MLRVQEIVFHGRAHQLVMKYQVVSPEIKYKQEYIHIYVCININNNYCSYVYLCVCARVRACVCVYICIKEKESMNLKEIKELHQSYWTKERKEKIM